MSALRIAFVALFIVAVMVLVAPSAKAQGLIDGTKTTFDRPIEIPGRVLPAGTYSFVQSGSVVQIWDNDRQLVATLLTNAAEQPQFAKRQEFEFDKPSSDSPAELKAWFLDSGILGHEFIYSRPREQESE